MSSISRATTGLSRGRLVKRVFWIIFPAGLIPTVLLGLVVYWYWQTWYYQPYAAFLQYAAETLAAALLLAFLVSWLAAQWLAISLARLAQAMENFASGNWEQRAAVGEKDALGGLAGLFNKIADDYRSTYQSLTLREPVSHNGHGQILERLLHLAHRTHSQEDLLQGALDILARGLSLTYAAIYLLERDPRRGRRLLNMAHAYLQPGEDLPSQPPWLGKQVNLDAIATLEWLVSRAIASGEAQVQEALRQPELLEAALPIMRRGQMVGVLDLFAHTRSQDARLSPFSPRALADLEQAAGLIALLLEGFDASIANVESPNRTGELDEAGPDRGQALMLYQASNRITQAETEEEALAAAARSLELSPYSCAILLGPDHGDSGSMRLVYRSDLRKSLLEHAEILPLSSASITPYFNAYTPVLVANLPFKAQANGEAGGRSHAANDLTNLPLPLLELGCEMGCQAAAFLPALRGGLVRALLVLGRQGAQASGEALPIPVSILGPYQNLLELLVNSLEKSRAAAYTRRQLAELRAFWNVSQAISLETNLNPLFRTIHRQLETVMGELSSFAIALYEARDGTIRIPYMYEDGHLLDVAPFPLGEGLTSILVRTRQPLLLADNVEEQSVLLGAKILGAPAKSWLGVPMLYSGEVSGAIIVQDIHQEKRFNEDDQRLLSTLANEVAVVVHNARLLERSRRQTQLERQINEISAKLRRSSDIQTILQTTAVELGVALGVQKAHIQLNLDSEKGFPGNGGGE